MIICNEREIAFENFLNNIFEIAELMKFSKLETYKKAKQSAFNNPPSYIGFVVFRLNQLIERHTA